jgi:DNA-directed RNA polymerase subunit RPC12/RpoP
MPEGDDTYEKEGYQRRSNWFKEVRKEKLGEEPKMTPGGSDTLHLEPEVKVNYITAQYLSTIIVASSVIEHLLYRQVASIDRSRKEEQTHTLGSIIDLAKKYDIVSDDVTDSFDSLDEINRLRNGVVHYREGHEEDALMQNMFQDGEFTHPNRYGKEEAEKMIRAMLDIKEKSHQNQWGLFDGEGPLVQGLNQIQTGREVDCPNCGYPLKDEELDYEADWNGEEVVSEFASCPNCGSNVIDQMRK